MESLFQYLDSNSPVLERQDAISLIGYLSQFCGTFFNQKEFENATKICYLASRNFFHQNNFLEAVLECLKMTEDCKHLKIDNHILYIRDNRYFQLLILSSLRHHKELFQAKKLNNIESKITQLLPYFYKVISPHKQESLHGLKFLDMLLKKQKYIFDDQVILDLLKFVNYIAVSQIEGFKYYGQSLAKTVLPSATLADINRFIGLNNVPVRGIPTQILAPILGVKNIDKIMIEKILQMFHNNIESRDAGFLYKQLMLESFEEWQIKIWPFFSKKMVYLDHEGEFFQSLLKYWIPTTVSCYKSKLYEFLATQPADNILKAYVLLETRKSGFYEEIFQTDLKEFTCNKDTSGIALKILCTHHKITTYPRQNELGLVLNYLHNFDKEFLENDQIKSLSQFFSQIFFTAHENLKKNKEYDCTDYKEFLETIFEYCKTCLDSNRKELGSQILKIIWEIAIGSSDSLSLNYKLEKKHAYEADGNRLFHECIENFSMYSKELTHIFNNILENEYDSIGNNMTQLISQKCYGISLTIDNRFLFNAIEKKSSSACIESTDTLKKCTEIFVSNNYYKNNKELVLEILKTIDDTINNNIVDDNELFKIVLYLETLYAVPDDIKIVQTPVICTVIEKCLAVIEDILEVQKTEKHFKQQKVREAFINITLIHLLHEKTTLYEFMDKISILYQMQKIITTCNMKRPTTLAGDVIRIVSTSMSSELEKRQRNDFLAEVLSGLQDIPTCQSLTIRKCPQSRLAVHALCLAENHEQKTLLHWCLDYICSVNTASALYCAEALIADNTLYSHTASYMPHLIMSCVKLFDNRDWALRNAILQLTKAIIDRCFGVLIGHNNRPKSVEDLFLLYPELAPKFYEIVSQDILTDSCMIIFQFFIESQFKKQAFKYELLETARQIFFAIFSNILKKDSQYIGTFAARSLISLCLEHEIPFIFWDVLKYLSSNFDDIKENHTLKNFILLLKELYAKYEQYAKFVSLAKSNLKIMQVNYVRFLCNFSQSKNPVFDFLSITVLPQESVVNNLKSNDNDFKYRVWQYNYLPKLIQDSNVEENLPFYLNEVLKHDIPDFIQIKILSVITKKYRYCSTMQNLILAVLFEKASSVDDSKHYLLSCYLKLILLLVENKANLNIPKRLIINIRNMYKTVNNLYKRILFIIILTKIENKIHEDGVFIRNSTKLLKTCIFEDEELRETVSESLIYFYENSNCDCQRYEILKIALNVLLNYGLYDFVEFHTKLKIDSPVKALIKLCETAKDLEGMYFCEFIRDVYGFVQTKSEINQNIADMTYFSRRNLVYVDQTVIQRIVLYFLNKP